MSAPAAALSRAIAPERQAPAKSWRILMLAEPGDRSAAQLALRLRARRWPVSIATLAAPSDQPCEEAIELASVFSLPRLLRRERPHILHCHVPRMAMAARAAGVLARVPVVVTTAAPDQQVAKRSGLRRAIHRSMARLTFANDVKIVPPGVDLTRFRVDRELRGRTRETLRLGSAFAWLSAGRFDSSEDHHSMLRAFSRVAAERPEAILLLAGDGPMRGEIAEFAASLRIDSQVRFLGADSDLAALMNAADACVLCSLLETLPPLLLEAGSTRLPVVAVDLGSTARVLMHGVTGLAAPPANPEALGDTMLHLMSLSAAERGQLALNAFAHISRHHDLEQVAAEWERIYQTLLERKGARP